MAGKQQKSLATSQPMNQQLRTRKDLLQAASRLLKDGKELTIDGVAKEALVSRATAYRYFSNIDDLLVEVPVDTQVPTAAEIFSEEKSATVESAAERLDRAEEALHESVYRNETQLRLMLVQSLTRSLERKASSEIPLRQNRRTDFIKTALAPHRSDFSPDIYQKLCASLALIFGPEAMIVFRDIVPLKPAEARRVKSWAIKTLTEAALAQSKKKPARISKNKL